MSTSSANALSAYFQNTFGENSPLNQVMAKPEGASTPGADASAVPAGDSSNDSSGARTLNAPAGSAASSSAANGVANGVANGDAPMDGSSDEQIFLIGEVGDFNPLFGSDEGEFIAGRFGPSTLFGNGGEDTLIGDLEGEGDDKLFAGKGDDQVIGNGGDDIVFGEEGNDFLFGGEGNDYLRGGKGADSLFGGTGADIFAVFLGEGTDTVFDFEADKDLIGLSNGLTFDQLTIVQQGSGTVISANGETLVNVLNTTATNFTADTFFTGLT